MVLQYKFIEMIIYVEIFIIFLILIGTFILRFIGQIKQDRDHKLTEEMVSKLNHLILIHSTQLDNSKGWSRLDLIIPVIYEFDRDYSTNPAWPPIKEKLLDEQLLPMARVKYKSKKWLQRFMAAQCFELKATPSDEVCLAALLNDPIRLVQLYAALGVIQHGDPRLIDMILNQMGTQRRLSQTLNLYLFEKLSKEKLHVIEERLRREENLYIRAVCYKLLVIFSHTEAHLDVTPDLMTHNLELRIAALRYLAISDPVKASNMAADLLSDTTWEIRAISLQLLNQTKSDIWLDRIATCLHDPVWWVRLNAANALVNLGDKGRAVLMNQNPNVDRYAYETAKYVLEKSI